MILIFISFKEPNSVKLYDFIENETKIKDIIQFVSIHDDKEATNEYKIKNVPCLVTENGNKYIGNNLLRYIKQLDSHIKNDETQPVKKEERFDNLEPGSDPNESGVLLNSQNPLGFGGNNKRQLTESEFKNMISSHAKLDKGGDDISKKMEEYNKLTEMIIPPRTL